jgi:hypothetical protein
MEYLLGLFLAALQLFPDGVDVTALSSVGWHFLDDKFI